MDWVALFPVYLGLCALRREVSAHVIPFLAQDLIEAGSTNLTRKNWQLLFKARLFHQNIIHNWYVHTCSAESEQVQIWADRIIPEVLSSGFWSGEADFLAPDLWCSWMASIKHFDDCASMISENKTNVFLSWRIIRFILGINKYLMFEHYFSDWQNIVYLRITWWVRFCGRYYCRGGGVGMGRMGEGVNSLLAWAFVWFDLLLKQHTWYDSE